jgi:hypothetical protein
LQLEIKFGWENPLGKQILRVPRRGEKNSCNMELKNVSCEDGGQMEGAHDCIQLWELVFTPSFPSSLFVFDI